MLLAAIGLLVSGFAEWMPSPFTALVLGTLMAVGLMMLPAIAARLWHHSLPERVQPAGYPSQVCQPYTPKGEECRSPQEVDAARQAYLAYREALDLVEGRCSQRHASVLRMAVRGEPSRVGAESLVREALTVLAGAWRVR